MIEAADFVKKVKKRYRAKQKKNELARVASLWNGFEGWLKADLVLMLMEDADYFSWRDDDRWGTVGVEYKAKLSYPKPKRPPGGRARKQVDL